MYTGQKRTNEKFKSKLTYYNNAHLTQKDDEPQQTRSPKQEYPQPSARFPCMRQRPIINVQGRWYHLAFGLRGQAPSADDIGLTSEPLAVVKRRSHQGME